MKRRVVVTGMEAVTGLGNNLETTWNGLIEGKSSVRDLSEYYTIGVEVGLGVSLKVGN